MNEHEKAINDAITSMRPTVLPSIKDELYKDCVNGLKNSN